jgi:hypothetical protein
MSHLFLFEYMNCKTACCFPLVMANHAMWQGLLAVLRQSHYCKDRAFHSRCFLTGWRPRVKAGVEKSSRLCGTQWIPSILLRRLADGADELRASVWSAGSLLPLSNATII